MSLYTTTDKRFLIVKQTQPPKEDGEYFIWDTVTIGDDVFWFMSNDEDNIDDDYIFIQELKALFKLIDHFETNGEYSSRNKVQQYMADAYEIRLTG